MKGLQDRNTNIIAGMTVENKGKLILTEIFSSVQKHDFFSNERTDKLAKKDAYTPFTGPEPVLGLLYSVVKRAIGDWMEKKHIECWKSGKDCKHPKALNKAGLLNC